MFALDRYSRMLLAGGALASFAAAFAMTPLSANGALTRVGTVVAPREPSAEPTPVSPVEPRRDPFIAAIADDVPVRAAATPVPANAIPAIPAPHFPLLPHLGPLPPNAGAGAGGGAPLPLAFAVPRLMAVANGPHPVALVSDGTHTHVIAAGDRFDHATVTHISDDGIELADGRHIGVVPADTPGGNK